MFAATNMMFASGFNPLSLAPALWLDSSDASTLYDATTGGSLTAAGAAVARWEDKSGNGRHMTQATGISQPLRIAAAQNGRDVVRFDGSNDFMTIASSTAMFNFLHNGTTCSVFAVVKMGSGENPNAAYTVLSNNGAVSAQIGVWLTFDDRASLNNSIRSMITKGTIGQFCVNTIHNDVWTPNQFTLANWRLDADNATAADTTIMRINGGSELKSNAETQAPVTSNASSDLVLGAIDTSGKLPALADFAELIVIPTAITDSDRLAVQNYLNNKWAIY